MADGVAGRTGVSARIYGCIEAGGTKFVCGVVREDRTVVTRHRLATGAPGDTLAAAIAFLREAAATHGRPSAIGIASFDAIDLDRGSATRGRTKRTPKPGWTGTDMVGPFASAFGCPVGFDTDVNAAIVADARWGAARGADVTVYVTVGTGIGGAIVDGSPVHGQGHP